MKLLRRNLIAKADSYKWCHWDLLPDGTTNVYSYLEPRVGAEHAAVLWFGLQYYLREYLEGSVVTREDIEEARAMHAWHFPGRPKFNETGWQHIVNRHGGRLPVRIYAAPEGSIIPVNNALMAIEATDPAAYWLTNYLETLLQKVWYPTTVATRSIHMKPVFREALRKTGGDVADADYMLHDFGYRGASSEESALIGGCANLVAFRGTDTFDAMRFAMTYYGAKPPVAVSVVATEHMVMTALGPEGEYQQALRAISRNEGQIVSLVADSYNYYHFVDSMIAPKFKEIIDRYKVKLVLRPDSVTKDHPTPASLVLWTLNRLAEKGYTTTSTGYKVVPYKVLWGDGLTPSDIITILDAAVAAGFAAQNLVFGMGGGLLQRVNRDTERFALKCSAQERHEWVDISKKPLDTTKASKAGRLMLVHDAKGWRTQRDTGVLSDNQLQPVFDTGVILRQHTYDEVRDRAEAQIGILTNIGKEVVAST